MSKYEAMNPEIKAKWLEALRSGQYKQGQTFLRQGDNYCCLGVLCDLLNPCGWSKPDDPADVVYFGNCAELPPEYICDKAELPFAEIVNNDDPVLNNATEQLALLNDTGKSFAEIADFIEENL